MRKKYRIFIALFGVVALSNTMTMVPAFADSNSGSVSSNEIENSISNVPSSLLDDVVVDYSPGSAAEQLGGGSALVIPTDPADGVALGIGAYQLEISLPRSDVAGEAVTLEGGVVAYPSEGESANAVAATDGGVQLLNVISSREASEAYSYDLKLPEGAKLEASGVGTIAVVASSGELVATIAEPWAIDARGAKVPTHYIISGSTITQIVEHTSSSFTYPVVADPSVSYLWWGVATKLTHAETKSLAYKIDVTSTAAAGAALCQFLPGAYRAVCSIGVAWRLGSWTTPIQKAASRTGRCAQINIPWTSGILLWNVTDEKC